MHYEFEPRWLSYKVSINCSYIKIFESIVFLVSLPHQNLKVWWGLRDIFIYYNTSQQVEQATEVKNIGCKQQKKKNHST